MLEASLVCVAHLYKAWDDVFMRICKLQFHNFEYTVFIAARCFVSEKTRKKKSLGTLHHRFWKHIASNWWKWSLLSPLGAIDLACSFVSWKYEKCILKIFMSRVEISPWNTNMKLQPWFFLPILNECSSSIQTKSLRLLSVPFITVGKQFTQQLHAWTLQCRTSPLADIRHMPHALLLMTARWNFLELDRLGSWHPQMIIYFIFMD